LNSNAYLNDIDLNSPKKSVFQR